MQEQLPKVAKYLLKPIHSTRSALLSTKKFEGLSADLQKVLREAAYSAGEVYSRLFRTISNPDLEKLTNELGVTFVDDPTLSRSEGHGKHLQGMGSFDYFSRVVEMIKGL